jgi:hypothetical protein
MMVKASEVKAKLDTHEAVCAERWKETILKNKKDRAYYDWYGRDYDCNDGRFTIEVIKNGPYYYIISCRCRIKSF